MGEGSVSHSDLRPFSAYWFASSSLDMIVCTQSYCIFHKIHDHHVQSLQSLLFHFFFLKKRERKEELIWEKRRGGGKRLGGVEGGETMVEM